MNSRHAFDRLRNKSWLTPITARSGIGDGFRQKGDAFPDRLPARSPGFRAGGITLGSGRPATGLLHVTRSKNGTPSSHPLRGPEIRALRRLKREYPETRYVFVTERRGPVTTAAVRKIIAPAGKAAGIGFSVHPHMLRHACDYKLANKGHDTRAIQHYMGHRNIQQTVRYIDLAAARFNGFWKD